MMRVNRNKKAMMTVKAIGSSNNPSVAFSEKTGRRGLEDSSCGIWRINTKRRKKCEQRKEKGEKECQQEKKKNLAQL
jgi:hypothetical protein